MYILVRFSDKANVLFLVQNAGLALLTAKQMCITNACHSFKCVGERWYVLQFYYSARIIHSKFVLSTLHAFSLKLTVAQGSVITLFLFLFWLHFVCTKFHDFWDSEIITKDKYLEEKKGGKN